jgi:TonB family protein
MVQVDIDAEGHVLNASVLKTSGVYGLDQAAIRAAKGSTFQPEITNCAGVAGSYVFEVDFPG